MKRFLLVIAVMTMLVYAKPMESVGRYNIILVHGAADSLSGVDCGASDLKAPFEYYADLTQDFGRIAGYVKEGLFWWSDDSRSTATGMIKTSPNWINYNILEGKKCLCVKMEAKIPMENLGGVATAQSEYRYCDNSCSLPGTLSAVEIKTLMPNGQTSTVKVEVVSAKKRNHVPGALFEIK